MMILNHMKMTLTQSRNVQDPDILAIRSEYHSIPRGDSPKIKAWLLKYNYLGTNILAQIVSKSNAFIRKLRKQVGITSKTPSILPVSKASKHIITLDVPNDWDNEAWLSRAMQTHSMRAIAKACHVSLMTICRKKKKYRIIIRARPPSRNRNYSWEWCNLHYTQLGWSQAKCAQKAGICQQTFANWLNHFNIPVRKAIETSKSHLRVRVWVRQLCEQLKQQPIVRRVYLRGDHIHVRFMNYFWETYYLDRPPGSRKIPNSFDIDRNKARIDRVPKVVPEYESPSLESNRDSHGLILEPHITISRRQLNQASFIEQRLAIHEFCRHITQRGWIWPSYPQAVLLAELERMRNRPLHKYYNIDTFTIFGRNGSAPGHGRKIIEHFFDLSDYQKTFRSPRRVIQMLNLLLSKRRLKFNTHNMLRMFTSGLTNLPDYITRFRTFDPLVYVAIFNKLGVKGSILDLCPGYGSHAMAAALCGLKYYTFTTPKWELAIDKGFADFVDLDHQAWHDQAVDLVLYDNDFNPPDISRIGDLTRHAKRLIMFVPHELSTHYRDTLRPNSTIKIKTRYCGPSDYLFVW